MCIRKSWNYWCGKRKTARSERSAGLSIMTLPRQSSLCICFSRSIFKDIIKFLARQFFITVKVFLSGAVICVSFPNLKEPYHIKHLKSIDFFSMRTMNVFFWCAFHRLIFHVFIFTKASWNILPAYRKADEK